MMRQDQQLLVESPAGYLDEGLFGRVFLWILEVLPYLRAHGIYPQWKIPSSLYGHGPEELVIPGALDLAYKVNAVAGQSCSLVDLRDFHCYHLGSEWSRICQLWSEYFLIPERIIQQAASYPVDGRTLAVHYRGTDKVTSEWDTNAINIEEFCILIRDFLTNNSRFNKIILATDEPKAFDVVCKNFSIDVVSLGVGAHHKAKDRRLDEMPYAVSDKAILDCLVLSRCGALLLTSSALSAFAKVLNPELEAYRCCASKMMWYGPYFPVAYIDKYSAISSAASAIIERTMAGDWTHEPNTKPFRRPFFSRPNWAWRWSALRRRAKRKLRKTVGLPVKPMPYFGLGGSERLEKPR